MIHSATTVRVTTTAFCRHNQKPPCAIEAWRQVDGVATEETRHTSAEGLLSSTTAYFPLIVAWTLNYIEVEGLGREYWKWRHGLGAENTIQFAAQRETWKPARFERAGSFVSKRSRTVPKNMPTEPRRQEKLLDTNARLPQAVTEQQRNWSLWFSRGNSLVA